MFDEGGTGTTICAWLWRSIVSSQRMGGSKNLPCATFCPQVGLIINNGIGMYFSLDLAQETLRLIFDLREWDG